jgi:protein-disulfide isomerase
MAGQQRLKAFYLVLGVIAVAGVVAIWTARGRGRVEPQEITPVAADTAVLAGHALGSDSAPVTVTEYADFECPACGKFAVLTEPDVRQRLVAAGEVRWVYHDFPLQSHPASMPAHMAAACAGAQGRFWPMHDSLYFNQGRWALSRRPERDFRDYAKKIGLDLKRYDRCMDSNEYLPRLTALREDALQRGISSTPTFDIGTRRVLGYLDYDSLKVLIDQAAARAR